MEDTKSTQYELCQSVTDVIEYLDNPKIKVLIVELYDDGSRGVYFKNKFAKGTKTAPRSKK